MIRDYNISKNMIIGLHLNFKGNCEEAMKIYKKVFNGKDMKILK